MIFLGIIGTIICLGILIFICCINEDLRYGCIFGIFFTIGIMFFIACINNGIDKEVESRVNNTITNEIKGEI